MGEGTPRICDNAHPLVSICCITYNHEGYIRDAIEGFLMQETDFAFEVLIHDDASTDGTADIIREYEEKYPEIIKPIYQTENQYSQGLDPSKNNYVRAKGEYIALCEGDDYWIDRKKLQKQVDALKKNPACNVCFHEAYHKYQKKRVFKTKRHRGNSRVLAPEQIIVHTNITMPTASIMMRGSILKELIEPRINIPRYVYRDAYFCLISSFPNGAYYLNEYMSVYRVNTESSVQKIFSSSSEKNYKQTRNYVDYYNQLNELTNYNFDKFYKLMTWLRLNTFLLANHPKELKRCLYDEFSSDYLLSPPLIYKIPYISHIIPMLLIITKHLAISLSTRISKDSRC